MNCIVWRCRLKCVKLQRLTYFWLSKSINKSFEALIHCNDCSLIYYFISNPNSKSKISTAYDQHNLFGLHCMYCFSWLFFFNPFILVRLKFKRIIYAAPRFTWILHIHLRPLGSRTYNAWKKKVWSYSTSIFVNMCVCRLYQVFVFVFWKFLRKLVPIMKMFN